VTAKRAKGPVAQVERGITLSVEAIIWAGLVLIAGALRLPDVGGPQVTVAEGARAFDAARVAGGEVPPTWQGDLAQAATSYLFRIFGETELVARLLPALAGVGLVVVLAFTRPYLGRVGALAAAALVAVSPLFVLFSRSATEFSLGPLVAGLIIVSLFAYLREPRPGLLFLFVISLALAPLTDPVAVLAALAVVIFIALEGLLFSNADVRRAWRTFIRSPLQWATAALVAAAALQFGITRFGTSLEGLSLPGVSVLWDMFGSPRDSRPAGYHFTVLSAYDWPLLVAGTAGFLFVALRFLRRRDETSPLERMLLLWTVAAAVVLVLTTRREATQLLILLTPLALLSGMLAEEIIQRADWGATRRWWPAGVAIVALGGTAAALMTEWSSGNADRAERLMLAASVVVGLAVLAFVIVRGRAGAMPVVAAVFAVAAAAFLAHSTLAVAFYDGTEFAVDLRLTPSVDPLRETIDNLARERGGNVVVDSDLMDELGWPLRDSPVTFGGPTDRASAVVSRPDANPAGFVARDEIWRVAEGWYPDEVLAPRRMWRWLLYREPYSNVDAVDVRIFVRTI
jgi:4-amino-4-deoxy-L-arabinose transferase-like glycosyltransferase